MLARGAGCGSGALDGDIETAAAGNTGQMGIAMTVAGAGSRIPRRDSADSGPRFARITEFSVIRLLQAAHSSGDDGEKSL